MAKRWRITAYDGEKVMHDWVLAGRVGHKQVELLLSRLQARHMSDSDIIEGTIGQFDKLRPIKTLQGSDFSTRGYPYYYTADEEDAN